MLCLDLTARKEANFIQEYLLITMNLEPKLIYHSLVTQKEHSKKNQK